MIDFISQARPVVGLLLVMLVSSMALGDESLREEAAGLFGRLEAIRPERLEAHDVTLGRSLFWDERLSLDGKTACASCHLVEDWGADRRQFSPDAKGKLTARNSQTIFNAVLQPTLRWNGDRNSGAQQAEKSLTGSMGLASAHEIVAILRDSGYEGAFRKAFPTDADPLSPSNYGRAIEAYETTLITLAPFDRFLAGDTSALDADQQAGLKLFISTGCADCHQGKLLGGESFEKFGVVKDYWIATKSKGRDAGRIEFTKVDSDRYKFRVSMLRNISRTGPYFHDGSIGKLDDAVKVMAGVQLGVSLSDNDAAQVSRFLESLTGEVPMNYSKPID